MSYLWPAIDGALGTMGACVVALGIWAVRCSGNYAVRTWRVEESAADAEREKAGVR